MSNETMQDLLGQLRKLEQTVDTHNQGECVGNCGLIIEIANTGELFVLNGWTIGDMFMLKEVCLAMLDPEMLMRMTAVKFSNPLP